MNDNLIRLSVAADLFPKKSGRPVHYNTLRRWIARGVVGRSGQRVRLRAKRIGGLIYTCLEWVNQFERDCSAGMDPQSQRRAASISDARRELTARGFYGSEKQSLVSGLQHAS